MRFHSINNIIEVTGTPRCPSFHLTKVKTWGKKEDIASSRLQLLIQQNKSEKAAVSICKKWLQASPQFQKPVRHVLLPSDKENTRSETTLMCVNSYLKHISRVGDGGGDDTGENATQHISQQRLVWKRRVSGRQAVTVNKLRLILGSSQFSVFHCRRWLLQRALRWGKVRIHV